MCVQAGLVFAAGARAGEFAEEVLREPLRSLVFEQARGHPKYGNHLRMAAALVSTRLGATLKMATLDQGRWRPTHTNTNTFEYTNTNTRIRIHEYEYHSVL